VADSDVLTVLGALRDAVSERTLRRATWWPRTVLHRSLVDTGGAELVEQVG
jgi:hypothetical protein